MSRYFPIARGLALACLSLLLASAATLAGEGRVNGVAVPDSVSGGSRDVVRLPSDEAELVAALSEIRASRVESALTRLESLVEKNPKFRLAQLIYADLLLARAQAITAFGSGWSATPDELVELRDEARARFRYHLAQPPEGALPEPLLLMSESQRRALVADVGASRLYLFENRGGAPALTESYYVSAGKNGAFKAQEGDQRTPLGVYFVVTRISGDKLPDLYGSGAFPVNYPNEWDRRLGRTGYGIWLHGVPADTYSRTPRSSDGCLAMPNADLEWLWSRLQTGKTPVIIGNSIDWIARSELEQRADDMHARLDAWRLAWESMDLERYAGYYSTAFHGGGKDYSAWMKHKQRVNAKKEWIAVTLSDVSIFGYPGERDLMVVTFDQSYRSSNFNNTLRKRQYWKNERDGTWRIVYEGGASVRTEDFRGIPYSARSAKASP